MGTNRLIKACEILDYAINNHVSAKAASKFFGFGKNYVSDVRRSYVFAHTEIQKEFEKKYEEYEKSRTVERPPVLLPQSASTISNIFINDCNPPEKKVFKIDVGNIAEDNIDEYIKEVMEIIIHQIISKH